MKIIEGDLLKGKQRVMLHQVNCMGVMGSGVALQIRRKYPEAYLGYLEFCNEYKREELLGKIHVIDCGKKIVINMFSQFGYGRVSDTKYTNYEAMKKALLEISEYLKENNINEISLPYNMGCDRGGGDWNIVSKLLEEAFKDIDVYVYKL